MNPIRHRLEIIYKVATLVSLFSLSGAAFALNTNTVTSSTNDSIVMIDSLEQKYRSRDQSTFHSVVQPLRHAQAQSNRSSGSLRSKSEVMQEVKSRYNAQVVKISLNERTATYSVRVLLPSGKIKSLSVSARK